MTWLIYLLVGFGVGYVVGRKMAPEGVDRVEAKRRIMTMLGARAEIANDDVQKELGVSDATATRYLDELESEGVLEQVGREGSGVTYRRIR